MKVGRDVCAMLNSVFVKAGSWCGRKDVQVESRRGFEGDVLIQTGGVLWLEQLSLVKDSFVDA